MQNQTPNLERYILAELQGMSAADTYIVSSDIWVDCVNSHKVVHVFKKADNTLVTTLYVNIETGAVGSTAPTGSITITECNGSTKTSFQIIDCTGANVGTPLNVEQTVVVNKVTAAICNTQEIYQPIVDELHDHIEPLLEKLADAVQTYQPVDCAGVNVGSPVEASNVKIVNATDIFCAIVSAVDSAKTAIVDAINDANTDITAAINASTLVLQDIKTELVTANTTLTNIKSDTTAINTKLDTVITKIDTMITSLSSIDTKLTTTNQSLADILAEISTIGGDLADIKIAVESIDVKLDAVITSLTTIESKLETLHTDLTGIKSTLDSILAELDYELIITSPTVNCADNNGTKVSFYTREKIVWDSETGTEVSKVVEYSLDGETFNTTKPTGTVSIGACVTTGDISASLVEFQIEDCGETSVGDPIDALPTIVVNKVIASICNIQELADAINAGAKDYTAVLNSIDIKLDELFSIKAELITANTTLTDIETNTTATNTKLDTVITKLDRQVTLLTDLKESIEEGNLKLDAILAKLGDILVSVDAIKVDIAEIKIDIEAIKVAVESIDTKLDTVITSLTTIESKLVSVITELQTINTTLQTEFDETQVKLDAINTTLESSLTSFQPKDCTGTDIGTPEVAQKSVILNKITASICNVAEITEPIVSKIESESNETQVILNELKDAFDLKGSDCTNAVFTKDCDRQELIDTLEAVNTLVFDFEKTYCGTANGVSKEYLIRQFSDYNTATKVKTARALEYSEDGLVWTTTAPADTTFVLGACPVEAVAPYCIENVSYNLVGNQGMILEANKIFEYDALVYAGSADYTEVNDINVGTEGYSFGNGDVVLRELLKNEVKIVNKTGTSDTRISVMQICGYMPIFAGTIDGSMVLLTKAEPTVDNLAINATFKDVPSATSYEIKRYVKGTLPSTATTLIDWTEGVANPLITNNGDGTYTYKDATAVNGIDYIYFYEAYNVVSLGVSNEIEASLLPTSFEPVMRTTATNELVTLPMTVTSPVTIDWGDGTTTTQSAPFTHTYATAGDYHIKVKITASREVSNFGFAYGPNMSKIVDIKNWGWVKLTGNGNFFGAINLEKITAKDVPQNLTKLSYFFYDCRKLTTIDKLADWNTSNVTTMNSTFFNCLVFNQSVSNFNTANVTDFTYMFGNAQAFNQSVSNFNTSKATFMNNMFLGAWAFNQSVSNFNTANVTNISGMFAEARAFNQSVSNFNTANVTNMFSMFRNAWAFNQSVSNFVTDKVTNMAQMFSLAKVFNQSVSNFNTANVTDFSSMFTNAALFNQPVPFNTAKATTMRSMFGYALAFNQSINFSIPLVTDIYNFIGFCGMNTTNVDNMLIKFANQTTQSNINLNDFRPRTSASDAAKATLVSRGWSASGW